MPCRIAFAKPEDIQMWRNYLSFHVFTKVRSPSYSPMAAWIFLQASSLETRSLYEMFTSLWQHFISKACVLFSNSAVKGHDSQAYKKYENGKGVHQFYLRSKRYFISPHGFTHVSRSSGLAKTILQGTVKGKRKRGRQKKRWEDNIKEWTGMDFASSTRAAENRSRWKGIVANSSVVPRRPPKVMG